MVVVANPVEEAPEIKNLQINQLQISKKGFNSGITFIEIFA
jgi:hypothetical protein